MRFQSSPRSKAFPVKQSGAFSIRKETNRDYTHYSNGVYMGGMSAFKRNGAGIVLLDNGSCAVTNYCFDSMTGHNVIFEHNAILSVVYNKQTQFQIAYKAKGAIILLPFTDHDPYPKGKGVYIDWGKKELYHLLFKQGQIIQKIIQTNKHLLNSVFVDGSLKFVMDGRHQDAFMFKISTRNCIRAVQNKENIKIGFFDEKDRLNGLGFIMQYEDNYFLKGQQLNLTLIQRGYFDRDLLHEFGQRRFKNGNTYIGYFDQGQFFGNGVLLYPQQLKWAYGKFKGGKLEKMNSMNTGQMEQQSNEELKQILKEMHEEAHKWMDYTIKLKSGAMCEMLLESVREFECNGRVKEKEKEQREESMRLKDIQQYFTSGSVGNEIDVLLQTQAEKQFEKKERMVITPNHLVVELQRNHSLDEQRKNNAMQTTFSSLRREGSLKRQVSSPKQLSSLRQSRHFLYIQT